MPITSSNAVKQAPRGKRPLVPFETKTANASNAKPPGPAGATPTPKPDVSYQSPPSPDVRGGLQNGSGEARPGAGIFLKVFSLAVSTAEEGGSEFSELALTSLKFPGQDETAFCAQTKLQDIRPKLEAALSKGQTFKFCADDCSAVPEDVSLLAYSKMLSNGSPDLRIYVVATEEPTASQASVLLKPPFLLKFIQMGNTPQDALNTGSLHSSSFKGQDPSAMPLGELRRLIGKMSTDPTMHCFCSLDGSEVSDGLALQEYLKIDHEGVQQTEGTPAILIRYRKTESKVSAAPSRFHGASPEVLAAMEQMRFDPSFQDRSGQELKMDTSSFRVTEELSAAQFAATDASPRKFTSQMDEQDWDAVLRNCSLLYGWKVNRKTNTIERAQTPAFRLRPRKIDAVPVLATPEVAAVTPAIQEPPAAGDVKAIESGPYSDSESGQSVVATPSNSSKADTSSELTVSSVAVDAVTTSAPTVPKALSAEDVNCPIPSKLGAVPSYVINDQSKIDVVTVSSEFQECMAKNHFSASSVEASVSGGYGGFSVGVSGGVSSESSSGQSSANKTFSKRMIANYRFPRVTVFLRPEDLEPTQELRDALEVVKKTKNINALRKLYATFGQLFCHSATLGGCLQTTKVVTGTELSQQTETKEKFKASVGVAVSTPFGVGGSVKASHETQDSQSNSKKDTQTSEAMAFEATGGNTILAADPPAWSGSVADFNNWRVIEQSELTPLVDAISQMPGCSAVRTWFFSAIPALSQYLVIPDSRIMHVRFKVTSARDVLERMIGQREPAYLGLNPSNPPKPVRTSIELSAPEHHIHQDISFGSWGPTVDLTHTTKQTTTKSSDALFFPHSTQAPVLMFPRGKELGTTLDPSLMQTMWRLEIAQGYSLGADTLVCIKSCAPVSSTPSPSPPDLALSVYRNAQGVFLLCITSSDEPSYWRFQRVSSTPTTSSADRFRHGENVRLTWSFADQASGYRDFYGDSYGRRSFHRPTDLSGGGDGPLVLKMPYPRFEDPEEAGIALIMSPALTADPVVQSLKIRPLPGSNNTGQEDECNYNLHDLTFRLDPYGGLSGTGDAGDVMNVISEAHEEKRSERTLFIDKQRQESPMERMLGGGGSPEAVIAGVLLGPLAEPIGAIGSVIGSIFGF